MTISAGDRLPDANLSRIGPQGPEHIALSSLSGGRKLVLFGLPGAFTRTCTAAHLPSFMRTAAAFREKGIDHVVCLAVNDPFVMHAWDEAMGASAAGIEMLADGASTFAKAAGLAFSMPALGFIDRCARFSALVDDGVVKILNLEEKSGTC
ncbi:MAG: peroxiredoxin, partial [Paracoccaceae bacterium]